MGSKGIERGVALVISLVLLGSLGYLLARALGGAEDLVELNPQSSETLVLDVHNALAWLIGATVAALAAVAGWWLALRRSGEPERIAREYEEQLERMRRARDDARVWNRQLSSKLSELQHREGVLGGRGDVRSLVLQVAINLLGAEKGLLLSRRDADSDGNFDVVAHEGFGSDPESSVLVQRFGGEVIERDRIVRIGREELPAENTTPADQEIENLVAIPIYISDEFHGVVVCANGDALEHDDEVLVALGDHAGAVLENSRLHGELRGSYLATVKMLADALEVKDPFLRGHSDEVSGLVRAMAARLELGDDRREQLIFGSLLHDVGKIGVSERILLKPGPLTDEEFSAIKLHPRIGYRLVAQLPLLQPIANAILHHHERWDGTGYPSGLAGERIPLEARVIAIIDAFSAMISDRPYQAARPVPEALEELERSAGTHFDPRLVALFVEEVRAGVPADEDPSMTLAEALDDPELHALRGAAGGSVGVGLFSSTDSLTLLRSHSSFREHLQAEVARVGLGASSDDDLALVVVRATNLRELNLELGYAPADRLLEELARDVERAAVDCGGIAGRESGSRMVLAVPGVHAASAESLAATLRERAPERLDVVTACATLSPGESGEELLTRASMLVSSPAPRELPRT